MYLGNRCKWFRQHEHSIRTMTQHASQSHRWWRSREGAANGSNSGTGVSLSTWSFRGAFYRSVWELLLSPITTSARWLMQGKQKEIIINWCSGKCRRLWRRRTHTLTLKHEHIGGQRPKSWLLKEQNTFEYWGWIMLAFNRSIIRDLCLPGWKWK